MADDITIIVGVALDKLTAGVEAIKSQFEGLKTALETVFAVGGLSLFVEKMAELGDRAERAAATLGISSEAAQELGVIAQISGSSMEAITTQLTRLTVGLERGAKETSIQSQALKALGISASQFISVPVDKQMNLLSDAVKRLHDQGINAAPALAMISRGLAEMMPQLVQGSGHMNDLRQRAIDVGAVVSGETTKALSELSTELTLLWNSLKGLGETIAAAINPAFKEMASAIGTAAGNLSALIATGKLGPYLWDAIKTGVQGLSAAFLGDAEAMDEVRKREEQLGVGLTELVKKYHDMIAAAAAASALKPVRVDVLGVDKNAMKEAELAFKAQEQIINQLYDTYQITELQKTQLLIIELERRKQAEIKAHEDVNVATAKAFADEQKQVTALTKSLEAQWKSAADTIAGAFNSQLRGLLAGTTSFGQAMKNVFASLIEAMIAEVVKLGVEWAAQAVFRATVGRGMAAAEAVTDIAKIKSDAALVFAGVYANLAPLMGPSAAGPAGESAAEILALLPTIPSFDVGTPFVPRDMLAMIHQGEAIIPAGQNTANNYGGNVSLNINAIDGRSVAQMLMSNKSVLNTVLQTIMRTNPGAMTSLAQSGSA